MLVVVDNRDALMYGTSASGVAHHCDTFIAIASPRRDSYPMTSTRTSRRQPERIPFTLDSLIVAPKSE